MEVSLESFSFLVPRAFSAHLLTSKSFSFKKRFLINVYTCSVTRSHPLKHEGTKHEFFWAGKSSRIKVVKCWGRKPRLSLQFGSELICFRFDSNLKATRAAWALFIKAYCAAYLHCAKTCEQIFYWRQHVPHASSHSWARVHVVGLLPAFLE